MNRHSPVPLWLALSVGVVLLAGVYVLAQRTLVPPQAIVILSRPVAKPSASAETSVTVAPSSTATPTPSAIAGAVPNDWLTYRNTKYGYEIKYPQDWTVSTPGSGAAMPAGPVDADITIAPSIGDLGFSIDVETLGSDDIGESYRSARNLEEYLRLVTSDVSTSILRFAQKQRIDGEKGLKYVVCSQYGETLVCNPRIYLQHGGAVYQMNGDNARATLSVPMFDQIISTFHFLSG
jgi:hypothetical protein